MLNYSCSTCQYLLDLRQQLHCMLIFSCHIYLPPDAVYFPTSGGFWILTVFTGAVQLLRAHFRVIIRETSCSSYKRRCITCERLFKMNTLSENFVHLSSERLPFLALFQSLKTQFLQLFRSFIPIILPHKTPAISPFRGHPSQAKSPFKSPFTPSGIIPFKGILQGRFM